MIVEYVVDGDTFVASGAEAKNINIRIWGIDTPEKHEPFYKAARNYLDDLIKDQVLECNLIDIDRYERSVMRCYLGDDDIGAIMVSKGLAVDYERFSKGYYAREQIQAKKDRKGMWR